jgi:hypothetical protein
LIRRSVDEHPTDTRLPSPRASSRTVPPASSRPHAR